MNTPAPSDERRPDPDALLERVEAAARDEGRAKLRIWLGASPGVGKTFSMLENAQRLRTENVDVVVGVVETHGRMDTGALTKNLPELSRRKIEHRGTSLEELDLDAALARKPAVVLLDELAHTNAPGSRHQKRWQDAMELLEAGIEVHTTLNVQHVESLNDVVAQITGVRVRETVPDALLERADEIELVDVPPDVVLARLAEGKVYAKGMAERAAAGFFKEGNLHALRELALRVTAERVDVEVQAWRRQEGIQAHWPTRERVLVCVSPSPSSPRLVRAARRMAAALHAPWIAAYVERPGTALGGADRARLAATLKLAESLGAEVAVLAGDRAVDAILDHARKKGATRIVAGKPTHGRLYDFLYGSLVDDLVRESGPVDVHVIQGGDDAPAKAVPSASVETPASLVPYARAAFAVTVAAGLAALVRDAVDLADVAMLFLVAIAITASFLGRGPSLFASLLSVATLNFFFVEPFYTFAVTDFRHVLTFAVMLCAGVLLSTLAERIRRQSFAARDRERRTAALYGLTRALAGARDAKAIAVEVGTQLRDVFESDAALLVPAGQDDLRAPAETTLVLDEQDRTVARWSFAHGKPAGHGLETLRGARILAMPLAAHGRVVGVIALVPSPPSRFDDPSQRAQLEAFVAQIASALERAQLADEARETALRAETEELRSSLLSSVSHDLRTPIASVLGAASALLASDAIDKQERTDLTTTIRDEAARLGRLVGNLLDMSRVESTHLVVKREWVPIEEMVGSALHRLEPRVGARPIAIDVPSSLLVSVDPVLFEQLLYNLLENAMKHTPAGTSVEVHAHREVARVIVSVRDRGQGIAAGSETRIFEKFVRASPGSDGVGLGLAIVRAIALAHGGAVTASNRAEGGASFDVSVPLEGEPPTVPDESEEPS